MESLVSSQEIASTVEGKQDLTESASSSASSSSSPSSSITTSSATTSVSGDDISPPIANKPVSTLNKSGSSGNINNSSSSNLKRSGSGNNINSSSGNLLSDSASNTINRFKKIFIDISQTLKKSANLANSQDLSESLGSSDFSFEQVDDSNPPSPPNVQQNVNQCFLSKSSSGEILTKPPELRHTVNGFPKLLDIKKKEYQWLEIVSQWNVYSNSSGSSINNDNNSESNPKYNEVVCKLSKLGVPKRIRGFIWRLSSGAIELEKKNLGVYQFFLSKSAEEYEYKIAKDIARTFPNMPQFCKEEGQNSLFNILKAYSVMDPEIGYTQGMSFIAAVLLSEMDELEAFWVFTCIMKNYKLSTLYCNDLSLLRQYLYVIDRLVETTMPKLFSHFKEIGVTPVLFASEWISTLFTYNFDIKISKRLMDVFFIEGRFYLHKLSLSILKMNEKQLLSLEFEEAVEFLKHLGYQIDPNVLFKTADSLGISQETIESFEAEFIHPHAPSDYF